MIYFNHQMKFLLRNARWETGEIIAYNELSDLIETQHEAELHSPEGCHLGLQGEVTGYQGPLSPSDHRACRAPRWHPCSWEEMKHRTFEPLSVMAKKILSLVPNARNNDLEGQDGVPQAHCLSNCQVLTACTSKPSFKPNDVDPDTSLGILIPNDRNHALRIDKDNDN
jgi:hypothetical protein